MSEISTGEKEAETATIAALKASIKNGWHRSVKSMLETGEALEKLKRITSRAQFVVELKTIPMSEQTAMRILKCWQRFGHTRSAEVLATSPAVLYVVAASTDEKVGRLIRGEELATVNGGEKKRLSEMTSSDARHLEKAQSRKPKYDGEVEEFEFDRELGDLCEEAVDEFTFFIHEAKAPKEVIKNKELLREYLREVRSCIDQLHSILR